MKDNHQHGQTATWHSHPATIKDGLAFPGFRSCEDKEGRAIDLIGICFCGQEIDFMVWDKLDMVACPTCDRTYDYHGYLLYGPTRPKADDMHTTAGQEIKPSHAGDGQTHAK